MSSPPAAPQVAELDDAAQPTWSSRPYTDADRKDVLALFTEPDFYYRTAHPDTRAQWEILELIDADTRLLFADGALIGLYGVEQLGAEHAGHLELHLRLRASAPESWWPAAYRQVVRALRWNREVIRLAVPVGTFDDRALRAARAVGLTDEGTLGHGCVREGRRHGFVFFAQIWEPT